MGATFATEQPLIAEKPCETAPPPGGSLFTPIAPAD